MREMKDSGIEWIGAIPRAWELNKIGAIYEERNTKVSDLEYEPLSVTKQGIVPQLETAAKTDNGDNRKLIRKNDFVINSRSDRRGSCGISEYDGSCSLINTVLKPRGNTNNKYYSFVFKSDNFADEFYRWGHGIVNDLWSTKWSDMKNIYIPSPTIDEQKRIADYLDKKCANIDAIIEKQQEIIEKLKEYKLSVITEAVTKGLNPDVEMKDSGVDYIGIISHSYKVRKIKGITNRINVGVVVRPSDYFDDNGEVPFLRGLNVKEYQLLEDNMVYISEEDNRKLSKSIVHMDDILIVRDGAIGTACLVPEKFDGSNVVSMIIVGKDDRFDSRYLCYQLNSSICKTQFEITKIGSALTHTSVSAVSDLNVVVPSVKKQIEIADYLDFKVNQINGLVDKKEKIILSLMNYKKSLIYEVVTGKREV
ncbi:MAG: restriction endonuclease subunit S [Pseudobutyrivibrio sp.]|nr:restriction endonuclease subunit S [Pseudobutyrivibrio sp.]